MPSDPRPELEAALRQIEALLAEGAPAPDRLAIEVLRLRRLAAEHHRRPPGDLLRQVAARLEPLARDGNDDVANRREHLDHARAAVDLLRRKRAGSARASRLGSANGAPPANDACAAATPLVDGTVAGTTSGATADGTSSCGGTTPSPDVWYTYTAPSDGLVVWDTLSSALDTVLSLHAACPDAAGAHELSCSDDARNDLGSLVARDMTAGETVWLRVAGAGGATGTFELTTDSDGGGIAGRVTKEATGEPLPEAWISLHNAFGTSMQQVPAEADGTYVIGGVAAGSWFVRADEPTLLGEAWNDRPCRPFCDVEEVGDPVTVGSGLTEGIDFALAAGGSISGTVRAGATGEGIRFVDVFAYDSTGAFVSSGSTDGSGRYSIPALAAGPHAVRTFSDFYAGELYDDILCGSSCEVLIGTPVEVAAGSSSDGIDFELERLGSISGRVTRSHDGAPVTTAFLTLLDALGRAERFSGIDSDGSYIINDVQPGDHFMLVDDRGYLDELYDDVPCEGGGCPLAAGTPIPVAVAAETAGVDFVLDVRSLLTGRITDAGSGEPLGGEVRVFDEHGVLREAVFNHSGTGIFEVLGLDPGTYHLVARDFGSSYEDQLYLDRGCTPSCVVTEGEPLVVASGEVVSGIDFPLLACTLPSHRTVFGTFSARETREACRTLRAVSLTVASDGDLTLRAGRSVVFGDGVRIETGGRLSVVIETPTGAP